MPILATDLDPDTRKRFGIEELSPPSTRKRGKPDKSAEIRFGEQLVNYGLPPFEHHFRFPQSLHPDNKRKRWIADYANHEYKLFVEIDGGIFSYGAHGHPVDITRNMMKQNDAVLLGYQTLRFATTWVKNNHAIQFLIRVLHKKGWRANA